MEMLEFSVDFEDNGLHISMLNTLFNILAGERFYCSFITLNYVLTYKHNQVLISFSKWS